MTVAAYGLLSAIELRLLDRILATGAFAHTPAAAYPPPSDQDLEEDRPKFEGLKSRQAMVEATAERVGDSVQYGSVAELLEIRAARPAERRGMHRGMGR